MQMPAKTTVRQFDSRVLEKQGALMVIHPGSQARFTTILHDSPRLAWTEPTGINAKAQRFKGRKGLITQHLWTFASWHQDPATQLSTIDPQPVLCQRTTATTIGRANADDSLR